MIDNPVPCVSWKSSTGWNPARYGDRVTEKVPDTFSTFSATTSRKAMDGPTDPTPRGDGAPALLRQTGKSDFGTFPRGGAAGGPRIAKPASHTSECFIVITLGTNVISALMLSRPDEAVVKWLDRQPGESIWTTSSTVFELRYGIAVMAKGRKRRTIESALDLMLSEDLEGHALDFDEPAAEHAAAIVAQLRAGGRPVEIRDTMIAGIAAARNGAVATRNTRHFADTRVTLMNPWASDRN